MPQYRKLHTKVCQSFDFNEMPDDFTRCMWLMLPLGLDCEGRGILNASWIKSKIMPLREDVTSAQILAAMEWYAERGMVVTYSVDGRNYFYIPTWKSYQSGTEKEAKSVLPAPPSTPEQVESGARAGTEEVGVAASASVFASESEYAGESESARPNIFRVYEQEIGALSPMISDQLEEFEKTYPEGWFVEAVREAKTSTTSVNLKYIGAILKRWKAEGKRPRNGKNGKPPPEPYTGDVILPDYLGGGS